MNVTQIEDLNDILSNETQGEDNNTIEIERVARAP